MRAQQAVVDDGQAAQVVFNNLLKQCGAWRREL